MILYELNRLYDRFADDRHYDELLPRMGYSLQKISFIVVLTSDGKLFDIQDAKLQKTIPAKGKKGKDKIIAVPRELIVCGGAHPSGSAATPRFLWDSSAYIFGYYPAKANKKEKDREKARDVLFPAYCNYHCDFMDQNNIDDSAMKAVVTFLKSWDPDAIPGEIREKLDAYGDNFGVFQIQGNQGYVFESPEIKSAWEKNIASEGAMRGMCLITGQADVPIVATIDTKIKLAGTSVGGGAISSFNAAAYESYGKKQTHNSPISEIAGFKACNALNTLIIDKRHHFRLADTTVVFWTGEKTSSEDLLAWVLGGISQDAVSVQDNALLRKLETFWQVVGQAGEPDLAEIGDDAKTPFYMLGIEPNAARIVVRFWHTSTLGEFVLRLREHQRALAIQKTFNSDPDHIPLWMLLNQTAREAKGIPPLLAGSLLRAVLQGLPYPESMYQLTLNRISVGHDDYKVGRKVSFLQASLVKAFLTRNKQKGELSMSLNLENKDPAYLLGRLFATLEKTQDDSSGGVNAGIGDKFYSSASATPRVVFPTLLDLFRKHLKKLASVRPGLDVVRDKQVGEILDNIDSCKGFPANLTLEERGMFALGYYQQMRAFFTKKEAADKQD